MYSEEDINHEESSSLDTLKQKFDRLYEASKFQNFATVSVVTFIGFSQSDTTSKISSIANAIIEKNVFGQSACCVKNCNCRSSKATLLTTNGKNHCLWMHCDLSKNTIYLLMDSVSNSETFLQLWQEVQPTIENEQEFQSQVWKDEYTCLRMLVFAFMLSHVVVLAQPISKLDSNMVSLLRTLSSVKRHIMSHANNFINLCLNHFEIPLPYGTSFMGGYGGSSRTGTAQGGMMTPGRCVPFIIFLFQEVQLSTVSIIDGNKSEAVSGSIKRIKEALQARIRFLFRTCHLVQTSDLHASFDSRQLFTLPPPSSQFFIHLITRGSTGNLLSSDPPFAFISNIKPHENEKMDIESLLRKRKLDLRNAEHFEIKLLKDFALGWIKWAATGYPRSFIKRGMAPSELPNAKQWIAGCIALQELLFGKLGKEILERKSFSAVDDTLNRRLKDCVQVNSRYSANHCAQVLRKAIDIYLLESPTYYTKQYHEIKLDHAMKSYMSSARGPCIQDYATKLRQECYSIWEHGRQKCEIQSLSGHECVLGANHDSNNVDGEKCNVKKAVKHRSAFQALHACNCGRSCREREDPFDLVDANVTFFQFPNCCNSEGYNYLVLPIEQQAIYTSMWSLMQIGSGSTYRSNSGLDKWEGFFTNANFLLPLEIPLIANLTKKVQDELMRVKETHGWIIDVVGNDINKVKKSRTKEDKLVNPSRKGFKQKGKNGDDTKNDSGSAWPILGSENNQQWTIPSTFYLNEFIQLIRDVQKNSIQLDETQSVISNVKCFKTGDINKEKRIRRGSKKESDKIVPPFVTIAPVAKDISKSEHVLLKGYMGVEYECPLGHRFMSCGGGQVCKLGHAGHIKETAHNILEQDLPIYILCPCSTSTNALTIAQLQRIIIVTPDSSVMMVLNPIIKNRIKDDTIISPMFNLQSDDHMFRGISLPRNSMVVLRLPYIHYDQYGKPILQQRIINHVSTLYLAKKFLFIEVPISEMFTKSEEAANMA
ncbi:protein SMG8 [Gigaspora margarita]|uniref:Nonsense-mediated mRNA decay factor SMG8 n=1 Tax=Gigaspora margarita TaxID=4874 RepID=A0A8H3XJ77_GIGMA|nr:protein SMG8 [Gigaspora margarita]